MAKGKLARMNNKYSSGGKPMGSTGLFAKGGSAGDRHKYYLRGYETKADYDKKTPTMSDNTSDYWDTVKLNAEKEMETGNYYAVAIYAKKDKREVSVEFNAEKEFAEGGKVHHYKGDRVYFGMYRGKFVVVSAKNNEMWANESFKTKGEAEDFAKENKFKVVSKTIAYAKKQDKNDFGPVTFTPPKDVETNKDSRSDTLSRDEMSSLLKKKFKGLSTKKAEEFFTTDSEEPNQYIGGLWAVGADETKIGKAKGFDYYNKKYPGGVHPTIEKVLTANGWKAEFYDPGTVFLEKMKFAWGGQPISSGDVKQPVYADGGKISSDAESFGKKVKDLMKEKNKWHFISEKVDGKDVQLKFFAGSKEVDVQIFKIDGIHAKMPRNYSGVKDTFEMIMENFKKFSAGGKPIGSTGLFEQGGRLKQVRVFKYNELSDKAKKKALEKFSDLNTMFDWWDGVYEDAKRSNIKITSFDIDKGDIDGDLEDSCFNVATSIVEEHGPDSPTHKLASTYLSEYDKILDEEDVDMDELDNKFKNDILAEYLRILSKEYEYLTSEEAIEESILSNDYDFLEDGSQATFAAGGKPMGSTGLFAKGGIPESRIDTVLRHYVAAALWSSSDYDADESGDENLDANYSYDDMEARTLAGMRADIKKFLTENEADLKESELTDEQIGHSFWLTRQHHGAGWFDYSLDSDLEKRLMDATHKFKETDLEVGDDGKVGSISYYADGGSTGDSGKLSDYFADKSVSHGTMNQDHVYEAFVEFLDAHKNQLGITAKVDKLKEEWESASEEDRTMILNEDIFDLMNRIAPEGTSFGSHTGDGSDYGFWKYDEEGGEEFAAGGKPIGSTGLFDKGGSAKPYPYKREFTLGKVDYNGNGRKINEVSVEVDVRVKENARDWDTLSDLTNVPEFTASASVWNSKKSDIQSGGQMLDELPALFPSNQKIKRLVEIWREYHLNDMKAGTKKQTEALMNFKKGERPSYDEQCNFLKEIGLYEDRGYKYGHGWLYEPVPESVLLEAIEIANSFPEFSRYESGGSVSGAPTMNQAEASNVPYAPLPSGFARGGSVARIANIESNSYSENRLPFKGNNLEGKELDNGDYVVLSYGYYPIWYWSKVENKWYGNSDKYSVSTAKQLTQSRPDWSAVMLPNAELLAKMNQEGAKFDLGGLMIRTENPMSTDNTLGAHAGSAINSQNVV